MRLGDRHIQSRPHEIHFAGWRSNTFALQQAGWEFTAQQHIEYDGIGLAFRHPQLGLRGVTNVLPSMFYEELRHDDRGAIFNVAWMTDAQVRVREYQMPEFITHGQMEPVDMRPQIVEVKDFDDMVRFAGVTLVRTNEIIVDPDDVSAMMDRILELQQPERRERLMRIAKENRQPGTRIQEVPKQHFHAQLVSIAA
jgi:hypothetical protein